MRPNPRKGRVKSFFKTPKGLLILILAAWALIAAAHEGPRDVVAGMAGATIAAGLLDLMILWAMKGVWEFPSGAVLTAMIVTMALRAQEPWYVPMLTSVAAVLSKYIFRSRSANVFNPAALAVVASFYVFHTGQSWWGAMPDVGPIGTILLIAGGVFIADRVNKMPLVVVFLGTYFLLFTITAYVGDARWVAEIFRSPDIDAALYFTLIILTDPPTSPAKYPDQVVFGILVAVVSFAFFEWAGVVYYLLAGVLTGNVWEAWRRVHRRSTHTFPSGIPAFLREISPWRARAPV